MFSNDHWWNLDVPEGRSVNPLMFYFRTSEKIKVHLEETPMHRACNWLTLWYVVLAVLKLSILAFVTPDWEKIKVVMVRIKIQVQLSGSIKQVDFIIESLDIEEGTITRIPELKFYKKLVKDQYTNQSSQIETMKIRGIVVISLESIILVSKYAWLYIKFLCRFWSKFVRTKNLITFPWSVLCSQERSWKSWKSAYFQPKIKQRKQIYHM